MGVRRVVNERYESSGELRSLSCARDSLDGPCVIAYGDTLFRDYLLALALKADGDIVVVIDSMRGSIEERESSRSGDFVRCSKPYSLNYLDIEGAELEHCSGQIPRAEAHGAWVGLAKLSRRGAALVRAELEAMDFGGRARLVGSTRPVQSPHRQRAQTRGALHHRRLARRERRLRPRQRKKFPVARLACRPSRAPNDRPIERSEKPTSVRRVRANPRGSATRLVPVRSNPGARPAARARARGRPRPLRLDARHAALAAPVRARRLRDLPPARGADPPTTSSSRPRAAARLAPRRAQNLASRSTRRSSTSRPWRRRSAARPRLSRALRRAWRVPGSKPTGRRYNRFGPRVDGAPPPRLRPAGPGPARRDPSRHIDR